MPIKLYGDYFSQPSRAVFIFCQIVKIPYQFIQTRLDQMHQRTPQFIKINPMKKVPAIVDTDNNMCLSESHAIMRYISKKYNVKGGWYPQNDLERMAKIDEYLDHHHTVTRKIGHLVYNTFVAKILGRQNKDANMQKTKKEAVYAVKCMQNIFLKNSDFIVGNEPSIADLSAYCEIQELFILFQQYDLNQYPRVKQWMKKLSKISQIAKADKLLYKGAKFLNPNL